MNVNWFKNPKNIIYANRKEFVSYFVKELGIPDLEIQIEAFRKNPIREGRAIKGKNRIAIKLLIPKLVFRERFEQDDCVWVYLGESYPCYCLCEMEPWWNKNYSFFNHKECEYFPCHRTDNKKEFNCLFCYCPLYPLKDQCGGKFSYHDDIKDCSGCTLPHQKSNYGYIVSRFREISEIAAAIKPGT